MMLHWARATCGMMGRSPDFMNVTFAAWAACGGLFRARTARSSATTCARYYEYIREHDLTLTHALINLQRSRNVVGRLNLEEGTALHVRARDRCRHRRARRARAGDARRPSPTRSRSTRRAWPSRDEPHSPFALNFAIPCGTPGLRFLCRESFDLGRSHFDHPLGSRFEEMDCVVFFDDVLVPWERVFLLGDVDLLNGTGADHRLLVHTRRIRARPRTSPSASSCSAWRC